MRIDKWLWFARFYKSRSLAAAMVDRGEVRLNGTLVDRPSREVRPGDELELPLGRMLYRVRILAEGDRRGPASEARLLYESLGEGIFITPL